MDEGTEVMPIMVVQEWFDGYSIHASSADREEYVKEQHKISPDYDPLGEPRLTHIWADLADRVYATKNGYRTQDRTVLGE